MIEWERKMEVKGKTIFITGGAAGIGLATAKRLLHKGANVTVYSRGANKIAAGTLDPARTLIIEGDVRERSAAADAMRRTIERFGSLDVLVNNAGVARRERFLETGDEDWDFVIGVNVRGVMICIQEFVKARRDLSGEGLVVNIASGAGIYGIDEIAVYSATKAAVINLSQSLTEEIGDDENVKFVTVCPGATDTKMFRELFPEETPYHTPEQVAAVICQTITGELKPDDRLIVDVFQHRK